MEVEFGGVGEGEKEKLETRRQKLEIGKWKRREAVAQLRRFGSFWVRFPALPDWANL